MNTQQKVELLAGLVNLPVSLKFSPARRLWCVVVGRDNEPKVVPGSWRDDMSSSIDHAIHRWNNLNEREQYV